MNKLYYHIKMIFVHNIVKLLHMNVMMMKNKIVTIDADNLVIMNVYVIVQILFLKIVDFRQQR